MDEREREWMDGWMDEERKEGKERKGKERKRTKDQHQLRPTFPPIHLTLQHSECEEPDRGRKDRGWCRENTTTKRRERERERESKGTARWSLPIFSH